MSKAGKRRFKVQEDSKIGSPPRQRDTKRRIAICSFQNRVCPRFDRSHEVLIFDGKSPQKEPIEKVDVSHVPPKKILNILAEKEVGIIITGGIQKRFQEILLHSNIDLIWGVAGEVHDVLEAYRKGVLRSGIGPL